MTYVQKYYDDLFLNNLENAFDSGLISHDEEFTTYVKSKQDISNFYVMNLSVFSDSEEDIYYDMTDVYNSHKITLALGSDLDDIGDEIGCLRPLATRASVELTFTMEPYDSVKVIPEGIQCSTNEGIVYYTAEDTEVAPYTDEVTVQALALKSGTQSRVLAETITHINSDASEETIGVNLTSVINLNPSSGGTDAFSDDDYRELLLNHRKENIRGSYEAFEKFFDNYDGLDSYKLIPCWDGSGTLKVVLDPGTPYQLNDVYNKLKTSVTQIDDVISMFSFEPVPIDIYAVCNVDIDLINPYSSIEKEAIKSRIVDAIRLYIDGNVTRYTGLRIGEDFIPYQLGVFIHDLVPELKDITFKYPRNADGEVVPITITDEQKGVANDIYIEME